MDQSSSEKLLASGGGGKRSGNKRFGKSKKERSSDYHHESSKSFRLFGGGKRKSQQERSFHEEMDKLNQLPSPTTAVTENSSLPTPLSVSVITTTTPRTRSSCLRGGGGGESPFNKASDDVSTLTDLSAAGAAANQRMLDEEDNNKNETRGADLDDDDKKNTTMTTTNIKKNNTTSSSSGAMNTPSNNNHNKTRSSKVDLSTPETQPEEDEEDTYAYTQTTNGDAQTLTTTATTPSVSTRVLDACHFGGVFNSLDGLCFVEPSKSTDAGPSVASPTRTEDASLMSQSKTTTNEWGTLGSERDDDDDDEEEEEEQSLDTAESDTLFKDLSTTTGGKGKNNKNNEDSSEEKHENFELVLDEYQLEQAKLASAAAADDTSGPNLRSKVRNWMRKREDDKRTMEKEAKQEKYRAIFGTDPANIKVETTTSSGDPVVVPTTTSTTTAAAPTITTTKSRSLDASTSKKQQTDPIVSPMTVTSEAAVLIGQNNINNNSNHGRGAAPLEEEVTKAEQQVNKKKKKAASSQQDRRQEAVPLRAVSSTTWEQRKIELERKLTSPMTTPSTSAYSSSAAKEDNSTSLSVERSSSTSKFEKDAAAATSKKKKKGGGKSRPTWKAAKDPKTGREYYYHRLTRTTTWTRPAELGPEDPDLEDSTTTDQQLDVSNKSSNGSSSKLKRVLSLKRNKGSMSAEQQKKLEAGEAVSPGSAAPKILKKRSIRASPSKPVPNKKKQAEISNILRTMSPPNETAINSLIKQYEGREDELLNQLKSMKMEEDKLKKAAAAAAARSDSPPTDGIISMEAKRLPFDEPAEQREAPPPVFSMLDSAMSSFGVMPSSAVMGPGDGSLGSRTSSPSPGDATSLARTRTGVTAKTEKTERTDKTDKTAKVDNTRKGNPNHSIKSFDVMTEPSAADTSISSVEFDKYDQRQQLRLPVRASAAEAERTRELRVEEFSSKHDSIASEKYAGKILRPSQRAAQRRQQEQQRKQKEREEVARQKERMEQQQQQKDLQRQLNPHHREQSDISADRGYMVSSEEDEMTGGETDDISALSDADMEYFEQKERLDRANRKALNTAMRNKDWDTAAQVTNTLRAQPLLDPTQTKNAFVPTKTPVRDWSPSDVDRYIARSDWNAVAKYIALMKEKSSKKKQKQQQQQQVQHHQGRQQPPVHQRSLTIHQPPFINRGRQQPGGAISPSRTHSSVASAARNNPRFQKRFGARSQLQRDMESIPSSSWDSDEDDDDVYLEDSEDLLEEDSYFVSESSEDESADLRRFAASRKSSRSSRRQSRNAALLTTTARGQQKFQC